MITTLRRHRQWLMWVIAILAIPFCFYFTKTDFSAPRTDRVGTIYDRPVTRLELQRNVRMFMLARQLGMLTFLQDLAGNATSENGAYTEFMWNRLVVRHEAEALGVRASDAEVAGVVKTFRPFRNETGFDMGKYNEFVQTALPSLGFDESQLEELAADQLALARLKELLAAGVQVPAVESKENYEQAFGKLNVAVVRLRLEDFAKEVKINDDDIAKYYEGHKTQLQSEEKRKVEFVTFALSDQEKKLTGRERVDALQKLADRANDFEQALSEKGSDFHALTAKFQLPIRATGVFTQAAPDPQLNGDPQLVPAAFQLTQQDPNSEPLQVADGFCVLHLNGLEPARPLSLDEAKGKVTEAIRNQRLHEMVSNKGAEIARRIRDSLKGGIPAEKAFEQMGIKAEMIPPFSLAENETAKPEPDKPPKVDAPDLPLIKSAVGDLDPGDASEFIPTESGGLVAVLEKREPIDPAQYEQGKAIFDVRFLRGKRTVVFYEWLRDRRHAAGVQQENS
ncbi:MAG: peptidylprolyl isomerase [Chthoniobacterales bacterium]|nr:peptidylprolyl isomerase [Chthoniobacterales bacterium]